MSDLHPEGQGARIEAAMRRAFLRYHTFNPDAGLLDYKAGYWAHVAESEARQAELERERDALKKALREIICCNHYGASFRDAERIARAALAGVVER